MAARLRQFQSTVLWITVLLAVPSAAGAGDWGAWRYGYRPKVYGSAPSDYLFPRYGFSRGYVYFEGPLYTSPALGDPNHCPPGPMPLPEDLMAPENTAPENTVPENAAPEGPSHSEADQTATPRLSARVKPATRVTSQKSIYPHAAFR
jgi:hypothetical protein